MGREENMKSQPYTKTTSNLKMPRAGEMVFIREEHTN